MPRDRNRRDRRSRYERNSSANNSRKSRRRDDRRDYDDSHSSNQKVHSSNERDVRDNNLDVDVVAEHSSSREWVGIAQTKHSSRNDGDRCDVQDDVEIVDTRGSRTSDVELAVVLYNAQRKFIEGQWNERFMGPKRASHRGRRGEHFRLWRKLYEVELSDLFEKIHNLLNKYEVSLNRIMTFDNFVYFAYKHSSGYIEGF